MVLKAGQNCCRQRSWTPLNLQIQIVLGLVPAIFLCCRHSSASKKKKRKKIKKKKKLKKKAKKKRRLSIEAPVGPQVVTPLSEEKVAKKGQCFVAGDVSHVLTMVVCCSPVGSIPCRALPDGDMLISGSEEKRKRSMMKPMTKEEWEKQQSKLTHVFDPLTGRTR